MRTLWRIAKQTISPCENKPRVMVNDADVDDIIQVIMYADQQSINTTDKFAKFLKGPTDKDTLRNIYRFVRRNISYVKDQPLKEVVRTPGCTIAVKKADCKSMSVMVGALLRSLGYGFAYRVAFYDPATPDKGHIYTVVDLNGEKVIVDPVHWQFNEEEPYWTATDYPISAVGVSGLPSVPRIGGAMKLGNLLLLLATAWLLNTKHEH